MEAERRLDCGAVRELLSDLLDARRGEEPLAGSPLAEPGARVRLEAHLRDCEGCRREMADLEFLCSLYAHCPEEKTEADFAGAGAAIRSRARKPEEALRALALPWGHWLVSGAAAAVAAVLTVLLLRPAPAIAPARVSRLETPAAEAKDPARAETRAPPAPRTGGPRAVPELPVGRQVDDEFRGPMPFDLWAASSYRAPAARKAMSYDHATRQAEELLRNLEDLAGQNALMCSECGPGVLGIGVLTLPKEKAQRQGQGLPVVAVMRGGAASEMGLRRGDYILAVNGVRFSDSSPQEVMRFLNAVRQLKKGEAIQVDFARRVGEDWMEQRAAVLSRGATGADFEP